MPSADYEYDIFISYKRDETWTPWVQEFFIGALKAYLGPLRPGLRIFVDARI